MCCYVFLNSDLFWCKIVQHLWCKLKIQKAAKIFQKVALKNKWHYSCYIVILHIQFFPNFFTLLCRSLNLMLYLIFVIVENNVIHNRVTYNIKETSTIVKQLHHNKNSELQLLQPLIILRGIYIPPSVFSTKNHKSH